MADSPNLRALLAQAPDLAAEVERLRSRLDDREHRQVTHWAEGPDTSGCWRHHLGCAVAEVERLREELAEARAEIAAYRGLPEGGLPGWEWSIGRWERFLGEADQHGLARGLVAAPYRGRFPDLDHPATAGCLLAMVPDLRTIVRRDDPEGWAVRWADVGEHAGQTSTTRWYPTLGRAAAAALLACWGEP